MTELFKNYTMTKFENSEFGDKPTNYYNLYMIIRSCMLPYKK